MKRKNINFNQAKFLMERMDSRFTLNEMSEKMKSLIKEGIGDDIIKAARKSYDNANVIKYADEIAMVEKQGNNIKGTLSRFEDAFTNIQQAKNLREALKELPDASSLRVTTKRFVGEFSSLIRKMGLEQGFDINLKSLEDFMNGVKNTYPTELLDVLSPDQLTQLQMTRSGIRELNLINLHLEKLNKIVDTWGRRGGDAKSTKNAFLSLIGKDGVESIEELKSSFKELDELENLDFELASDLNDSWLRIKEDIGLDTKNLDIEIQKAFRNDPSYQIVEKWLRRQIDKLVYRNIDRISISLKKLENKNIDWDRAIIYQDAASGDVYIIQFKNRGELDIYKKYLKRKGLNFTEAETMQEAIEQMKELAKAANRWRKIRNYTLLGIGGGLLSYTVICPFFKESLITPEMITKRKEEFGEGAAIEEEDYLSKMGRCWVGPIKAIVNWVKGVSETIVDNVKGLGQDMVILICDELKEICPNWECCHTDDCGDKQKECCMECNDETKIEKIADRLKDRFAELIGNVEVADYIINEIGEGGVDLVKNSIKKDGILSGILFKDGKAMSIVDLIKLTCTKQSVKCVGDRVNEIFTYVSNELNTKDCETLQNEDNIPMKLEELRRFNDSGYLSLEEEEGKVYINWKEVNPVLYGSASNVEECINIMQNTYTKVILDVCRMNVEDNGDIPVEAGDYESWCEENGKDSSVVKSLMEYLWKEEVVKLECTTGEDGIEVYFEPTKERKDWAKYVIYDLFNKEFKSIFPQVDAFSDGWDDAFNYWYDKQKNECNF